MRGRAIPDKIRNEVLHRLARLETDNDITVLFAIESGSRAWGFASSDSDYDVRFIYMHKPTWYWHLDNAQENIENESRGAINIPITDDIDIAGWDLRKTLALILKSNPPLFEWLRSPIIYKQNDKITAELLALSETFYSANLAIHHYLHMADGNFRQYLINRDEVISKKYLYVIRPILACRWIEMNGSFPPMEIDKTLSTIDEHSIKASIVDLIEKKKAATELGLGPANMALESFLGSEINRLKMVAKSLPKSSQLPGALNSYFQKTLMDRMAILQ